MYNVGDDYYDDDDDDECPLVLMLLCPAQNNWKSTKLQLVHNATFRSEPFLENNVQINSLQR